MSWKTKSQNLSSATKRSRKGDHIQWYTLQANLVKKNSILLSWLET